MVIPEHYGDAIRNQPGKFVMIDKPLPFVAEVWSVSTGTYDVKAKLPIYQQRGDAEIWLIHPYDRVITAWRRQPDGTYGSSVHDAGMVELIAIPGVVVDIAELFS
jgi:Uma2 family endonuclease